MIENMKGIALHQILIHGIVKKVSWRLIVLKFDKLCA